MIGDYKNISGQYEYPPKGSTTEKILPGGENDRLFGYITIFYPVHPVLARRVYPFSQSLSVDGTFSLLLLLLSHFNHVRLCATP